jgi:hypothetical protein
VLTLSGDGEVVEDIEAPAENDFNVSYYLNRRMGLVFIYQYSRVKLEKLYSLVDLDHGQ